MCTVQYATTVATMAGTFLGAQAQASAADYNAEVAVNNAALARQQAIDSQSRAALERDRSKQAFASASAKGKVAFAAGNVLLNAGGTPAAYQADLDTKASLDISLINRNQENEENAFLSKSNILLQEAELLQKQSRFALAGGALNTAAVGFKAAPTLLGQAKQVRKGRTI